MIKNRVAAIEIYTKDSSALTGGYDIFCDSLDEACFLLRIINASNKSVYVSYDNAHDHDIIPGGTVLQLSFQANNRPRSHVALMSKGQAIYLKGAAGTGYIHLAGYYSLSE